MTERNGTNFFQRIFSFIQARKLWPYLILLLAVVGAGAYFIFLAPSASTEVSGGDDPVQIASTDTPDLQGTAPEDQSVPTSTETDTPVAGTPTITRRPTSTDPPRNFRTFTPTSDGSTETPDGWTPSATLTPTQTGTNTPVGWTASPTRTSTNTPVGWTPSPTRTATNTPVPGPLTVQLGLTASPTSINEPGGTIVYTVKVTNTFSGTMEILSLIDSMIADLSGKGTCNTSGNPYPSALASGASYSCTFSVKFLGDPDDVYQNTVTVQVEDTYGRTKSASAGAVVTIKDVLPAFTVRKTASAATVIEPGDNVSFTIEITNTSIESLTLIQLLDDQAGNLNGVGSCDTGVVIPAGDDYFCEFDADVTGTAGDTYTNIVSARLMDNEYNTLTLKAEESVQILPSETSTVSGHVRFDQDGDGNMSDPDPGLPGVEVELEDVYCTPGVNCPVDVTDQNGVYSFTNVGAGSYIIVASDLPGYFSTNDSAPPNDNRIPLTVAAGVDYPNNDFIDATCPGPDDVNGYVSGTNPANNAVVNLSLTSVRVMYSQPMSLTGGGSVLDRANYNNGLTNLTSGGSVPFTTASYEAGTNTVTLNFDSSDPDWRPGSTYRLEIQSDIENSCGEPQGVDVLRSFSTRGSISGQVRLDADGDGDLGDADQGISGVRIELTSASCVAGINCPTTVTDAEGKYSFKNLAAGNYVIRETDPPGYNSTNDYDGGDFNLITVLGLDASETVTGMDFLDKVSCSNPNPVTGFVSYTIPGNMQTAVVLTSDWIVVKFNQPMIQSGSGSVTDTRNYALQNLIESRPINLSGATYDAVNFTAYITVNTSANYWRAGGWYQFTIEAGIQNSCGTSQGVDVLVRFQIDSGTENSSIVISK